MKALIVLVIVVTLGIIFFQYSRTKNLKKLLLSLGSFAVICSLGVVGGLTRPIPPLFIAHLVLIVFAWGALFYYMVKERYYWWMILSPVVTIVLFLVMEYFAGSGHEGIIPSN